MSSFLIKRTNKECFFRSSLREGPFEGAPQGSLPGPGWVLSKLRIHAGALAELTHQIQEAATIEALLYTHCAQKGLLNHIHLSACWSLSCDHFPLKGAP